MIEDLYFINAKALAVKLHQQEVSEDLAFKHLLVFSMLFASALVFPVAVSCTQSDVFAFWYQIANFFAFALLQFWGMRLLYRTNKQGDGQAFFLRWAALSLPVGLQVWLISLLLGLVYGILIGFVFVDTITDLPENTWLISGMAFGLVMQLIYYFLMQRNFKRCANG